MNELLKPVRAGESALEWQDFKPFQLVSLWDMLLLPTKEFFLCERALANLQHLCTLNKESGAAASEQFRNDVSQMLKALRRVCDGLALQLTEMAIDELIEVLEMPTTLSNGLVTDRISAIRRLVRDELTIKTVYVLGEGKAAYYENLMPFGQEVFDSFPSANFDIEEASKCHAVDRHTACVFHVSRALESPLRVLAKRVGADPTVPGWDSILGKIDTEMPKRRNEKDPAFLKDEHFYSEAALHIRSYKTSRNNSMHLDQVYTPEQAERIYNAVKLLMQHLATKLAE